MPMKFYIDNLGKYLGEHPSETPPNGGTVVSTAPEHAEQEYDMDLNVWKSNPVKEYALYQCIATPHGFDTHVVPMGIDFLRTPHNRLARKETFEYGELQEMVHYHEQVWNDATSQYDYNEPMVRETFEYTRDVDGLAISRVQTISWFYMDGTEDTTNVKTREKIYADTPIAMLQEIIHCRDNNIKNIIGMLISLIMTTRPNMTQSQILSDLKSFFKTHSVARTDYLQDGTDDLEDAVRDESGYVWLADDISTFTPYTTIRGFIINELSNGVRNS